MKGKSPNGVAEGIARTGQSQGRRWFIPATALILATTGFGKLWVAFGKVQFLTLVDPIVGIPFKHLMLIVGVTEVVVALVCFFCRRRRLVLGLIAWLATSFLVYRLGLWWMDWKSTCGCLGKGFAGMPLPREL